MKFTKTFCAPSSVVDVIPAGLPVKLQYNENGLLQTFKVGFSPNLDPMYEEAVEGIDKVALTKRMSKIAPPTIMTKGGTTWIYGIFYTDNIPVVEGKIPQALYKSYIDAMLRGDKFEFYAGYVHSLAVVFQGALQIRNYLSMNKFNILPQVIVPVSMQDFTLTHMMDSGNYSFNKSYIAGYFIYEQLNCRYVSDNLFQIKVANSPKMYVDSDGYWKAKIVSENKNSFTFSQACLIHHNVTKGSILLMEKDPETEICSIVATRLKNGAQLVDKANNEEVKCPICGKINRIGSSIYPTQCDDPHCMSHLYEYTCAMLRALKLETLDFGKYIELVKAKEIMFPVDVFMLPEYKDKEVSTSLAQALRAVIPFSVVTDYSILERFANKCNNNIESAMYYLSNPLRIETDLDITELSVRRLIEWLEDPYNVSSIEAVFKYAKIEERKEKFEGDPIFRGNTFVLTGKFKRGDFDEIASILQSYSATVKPSIELGDSLPNCIITGSCNDGVSGKILQKAKIHNIPVMEEDAFFAQYEIDEDLRKNLL